MRNRTIARCFVRSLIMLLGVSFLSATFAEESTAGKMEDTKNKAVDSAKSSYRGAKDKACEMVNGKLQCAGKKIMHKTEDLGDKVKTDATSVKNKTE